MLTESEPEYVLDCLPQGPVQVRRTTRVLKDGTALGAPLHHRRVVEPGDDISDLPEDAQAVILAHWTEARVAAWRAAREKAEAETP
jgi:hypothetical protein